jgi:hypothetical protein
MEDPLSAITIVPSLSVHDVETAPAEAEPAAPDIPAAGADPDPITVELIAAQLPQILMMHDPGHGSQVRSCSREPPRGDQYLVRGQDAHHDSMGTCGAP